MRGSISKVFEVHSDNVSIFSPTLQLFTNLYHSTSAVIATYIADYTSECCTDINNVILFPILGIIAPFFNQALVVGPGVVELLKMVREPFTRQPRAS